MLQPKIFVSVTALLAFLFVANFRTSLKLVSSCGGATVALDSLTTGIDEDAWGKGIDYEVDFWKNWLDTSGQEWKDDFDYRLNPDSLYLKEDDLLRTATKDQTSFKVLDVGAGPIARMGWKLKNASLSLEFFPTDPLAIFYDMALDAKNIVPIVRTRFMKGEDITKHFAKDYFDLTHSFNALDHAQDPLLVVKHMVDVTKPGKEIHIEGASNEQLYEKGVGFHNWNFANVNSDLIFWNQEHEHNVSQLLGSVLKSLRCNDEESLAAGKTDHVQLKCILTKAGGD